VARWPDRTDLPASGYKRRSNTSSAGGIEAARFFPVSSRSCCIIGTAQAPVATGIAMPVLSYGDVGAGQAAWWRLVAWRVPLRFLVGTQNQVWFIPAGRRSAGRPRGAAQSPAGPIVTHDVPGGV
jgi:hypothetical protein